jgi:hypothetical protein
MSVWFDSVNASLSNKYADMFRYADQCIELSDIILKTLSERRLQQELLTRYQYILAFNYYKATNSMFSLLLLCDRGFVSDAKMSCRRLVETAIHLRYLSLDPAKRQEQYWGFMYSESLRALRKVRELHTVNDKSPQIRELTEEFERLRETARQHWDTKPNGQPVGDFEHKWSGKDTRGMAEDCGMLDSYDTVFRYCCAATHCSIDDVTSYLDCEGSRFRFDIEHKDTPWVVFEGCHHYLLITSLVAEAFGLELEGSIVTLRSRIEGIVKPLLPE